MSLLGRDRELAACWEHLTSSAGGAAVVVTGHAGIGKTALCRTVVARARAAGWEVLETTGLQSEVGLPLGGLTDLLAPAAPRVLPALPAVQRDALAGALSLTAAAGRPEEALLRRAAVTALRQLAGDGLLLVVDDEQWLDEDTRRILCSAAARLGSTGVRWLIGVRGGPPTSGLGPVLQRALDEAALVLPLATLPEQALHQLVLERFPGRWSPQLLRQICALAAGSPYTALELARHMAGSGGQLAEGVALPTGLAADGQAPLRRLSPGALAVTQVVALATRPTRDLLVRALEADDPPGAAVDEALAAEVLEWSPPDPVLRFGHPLVREAVTASLDGPLRRRLHRRLADLADDPDEAAAHLAAGTEQADERVADLVQAAAQRALARGAPYQAAVLAQAAVGLSVDQHGPGCWRRRLLVLDGLTAASEFDRASALARSWAVDVPAEARGELAARQGALEPDYRVAARLLHAAVDGLQHDPRRAAEVGAELAVVEAIHLLLLGPATRSVALALDAAAKTPDPAVRRRVLAVDGFVAALAGAPDAATRLERAVALPGLASMPFPYYSPETRLAMWHTWRGEVDRARELHQVVLAAAERLGSEESAHGTRLHLVEVEWRAGRWSAAADHAHAVRRYVEHSGAGQAGLAEYGLALVEAAHGRVDRARTLARRGIESAEATSNLVFAAQCRCVLGQVELSVDDPAAALAWLEPVARLLRSSRVAEPGLFPLGADLVESLARTGRREEAAQELARLQQAADVLDHPWARVAAGRGAAAVQLAIGNPVRAVEAAAAGLAEARALGLPFEVARCLLVLGTAERRARRRTTGAHSLDLAASAFVALGAPGWAALAGDQRTRLTSPARGPGEEPLTTAERRVADLAAQGLTNDEIAVRLFLSRKTVEANLTRVFRKLDCRNRVELVTRLRR